MGTLICEACGASGANRCYMKCPFYIPLLKWKKPDRPGFQSTHCGRYFVERERFEDGFSYRWHPHRTDMDEALSFDYFATREEAKAFCEKDVDEEERKISSRPEPDPSSPG